MCMLKPKENTIKVRCKSRLIFAHLTRIIDELEEYLNEYSPKELYFNIAGDRNCVSNARDILEEMKTNGVIRSYKLK